MNTASWIMRQLTKCLLHHSSFIASLKIGLGIALLPGEARKHQKALSLLAGYRSKGPAFGTAPGPH